MPRSATVRVLHSLLVFSSCRWYQNKSSHFFLPCQHFSMLNCSRPNVHRFQSSDAGGGILCGARSNHGGLQVSVINSLTFILKAFIIFIAGWERCSSLQWQSLACACTRLKNIIKTSKYHHLLLPAGHPGPRAHSWPLRPFPISSKFIQPILTKNWPSCCCKLYLFFNLSPGDPHKPLREQLVLDPLHHLPLSPDCLQVRTASSSTWSWSLVETWLWS